ncbi:MarR family transcriptional regulator [Thaumasiovibrio subtropicus]|uniref:MarR family transcriptional regulator n=1 Tax=Thaumasiovibrio subtropicus TaxID=1891207 RepID=UPI000B357391|nr:MarR family transcriptional regulator [Thaumasiovibrio subtropicus]
MRISHKRKVQLKLNKKLKLTDAAARPVRAAVKAEKPAPKAEAAVKAAEPVVEAAPKAKAATSVALTPKQQQVLDIVHANAEGINPKGIGLAAGQEDAKAASWATGALKKLAEEGLVERIQLAGNKVLYKAA